MSQDSLPDFLDNMLRKAIHSEEVVESEVDAQLLGNQIRRVFQTTQDRNGEIVRSTLVERIKLTCGCLNQAPAARCVCGSVVLCAQHKAMVNTHCSNCMRFFAKCCGVGLPNVRESHLCLDCYYAMSVWQSIKFAWKYGL